MQSQTSREYLLTIYVCHYIVTKKRNVMKQGVATAVKTTSFADLGNVLKKLRKDKKSEFYADFNKLNEKRIKLILSWITDNTRNKGEIDSKIDRIVARTKVLKDKGELSPGSIIYAIFAFMDRHGEQRPHESVLNVCHKYRNYCYEVNDPLDSSHDCVNTLKRGDTILIELPNSF